MKRKVKGGKEIISKVRTKIRGLKVYVAIVMGDVLLLFRFLCRRGWRLSLCEKVIIRLQKRHLARIFILAKTLISLGLARWKWNAEACFDPTRKQLQN